MLIAKLGFPEETLPPIILHSMARNDSHSLEIALCESRRPAVTDTTHTRVGETEKVRIRIRRKLGMFALDLLKEQLSNILLTPGVPCRLVQLHRRKNLHLKSILEMQPFRKILKSISCGMGPHLDQINAPLAGQFIDLGNRTIVEGSP